jgi:hypothetical protein
VGEAATHEAIPGCRSAACAAAQKVLLLLLLLLPAAATATQDSDFFPLGAPLSLVRGSNRNVTNGPEDQKVRGRTGGRSRSDAAARG